MAFRNMMEGRVLAEISTKILTRSVLDEINRFRIMPQINRQFLLQPKEHLL